MSCSRALALVSALLLSADLVAGQNLSTWHLADRPSLDIGSLMGEPEYEFGRLQLVRSRADGSIVALDHLALEIRAYDSTGRHLFSSGKAGEGPGEFKDLSFLGLLPPDSILVFDRRLNRVSIFSAEGAFSRSFPLRITGEKVSPWVVGLFESGRLLVRDDRSYGPSDVTEGILDLSSTFRVVELDETMAAGPIVLNNGRWWIAREGRGVRMSHMPFDAGLVLGVGRHRWYHGFSSDYTISAIDELGGSRILIARQSESLRVTSQAVEQYLEWSYRNEPPNAVRDARRRIADMPLPEAMPHFSGILEDPNGRIWVEEWTWPRTEARRWRIFTGEGEAIAELHVPRSFMIRQVDSDSVLGVWSDDLDVQYIRRYQIIR